MPTSEDVTKVRELLVWLREECFPVATVSVGDVSVTLYEAPSEVDEHGAVTFAMTPWEGR